METVTADSNHLPDHLDNVHLGRVGNDSTDIPMTSIATEPSQKKRVSKRINKSKASLDKDGTTEAKAINDRDPRCQFTASWLQQHYEVCDITSVQRSTVFTQYTTASTLHTIEPVNPASFGKIIRAVFPTVRTRRLGNRGASKYHYFGIIEKGAPKPLHWRGKNNAAAKAAKRNSKRKAAASEKKPKRVPKGQQYQPLIPDFDEFGRFVEQICQPIAERLPEPVSLAMMTNFASLYQKHVGILLRLIARREFHLIEMALRIFVTSFPQELVPCLECGEGLRIVSIADDYLFQVAIHVLVPDVLEALPLIVAQSIRYFAKSFDVWMRLVLVDKEDESDTTAKREEKHLLPESIVNAKLDIVRRFCQVLRRRTSLNHLAQAVRTILATPEHSQFMHADFNNLDQAAIREQLHWIALGGFIDFAEAAIRSLLGEAAPLGHWTQWVEGVVEQSINCEVGVGSDLETASRMFALRWSFFTNAIMREMTLRSAPSFGSFHLLRLMLDEYVMYYLERKLDEQRRSAGLLTFWPMQQDSQGQVMMPAGYETTMAGFTSMDELFRKSGFLAYAAQSKHATRTRENLRLVNEGSALAERDAALLHHVATQSASQVIAETDNALTTILTTAVNTDNTAQELK